MARSITVEALAAQEADFARAFTAKDLELVRALYDPDVVYVSPTVRLYGWPAEIEGVEKTLEFIALTIRNVENVRYEAVESAIVPAGDAAFVRIHFDWSAAGRRLRSNYIVIYRYRSARILRQELYYDPSGRLEELD
jgi:ketosteroid isomerase-like protein